MNDIGSDQPLDHVIDQIVDGALGPGELRVALARIESEANGWKRCTLAFLEAQCWGQAFRAFDEAFLAERPRKTESIKPKPARHSRLKARWWRSAAAAGIIATSFALGWLSHVSRTRVPSEPTGLARFRVGEAPSGARWERAPQRSRQESRPPGITKSHSALPVAASPGLAREIVESSAAADGPGADVATFPNGSIPRFPVDRSVPDRSELIQTVAELRIGNEAASATVPILAGPGIDGDWLNAQPPPLSEHDQAVLQRLGYQVDQRRRVLVGKLADGRPVTVPIDQVEIRYTGSNPL
jgi:hypothetical protein